MLIDRFFKNIRVSRVTTDNIQGTFDAITYLLNKGHRHIAYISPEITNSVTEDRAAGYENAYLEQQFPIDKTLWCLLSLQTIQQGRAKDEIAEFLKEREHVTAIFTVNVQLAHFVYNYLRDYDLLDRIELITFDDPELPDVSYVAQNIEEISQKSIEFLKIQLQGTEAPLQHLEPATLRLKNES
ncbi:HTH-type transcriptional regulator DegA [compost metagenome]